MATSAEMVESFFPRGIGLNTVGCFVYGSSERHSHELDDNIRSSVVQPDMASFVMGRKSGLRIVSWFEEIGSRAFLDFRPNEPVWIQVKVGACQNHKGNLERLQKMALASDCTIYPDMIKWAMQPLPLALKIAFSAPSPAEVIGTQTATLLTYHSLELRREAGERQRVGRLAADSHALEAVADEYFSVGKQVGEIFANLQGRLELAYWRSVYGKDSSAETN